MQCLICGAEGAACKPSAGSVVGNSITVRQVPLQLGPANVRVTVAPGVTLKMTPSEAEEWRAAHPEAGVG